MACVFLEIGQDVHLTGGDLREAVDAAYFCAESGDVVTLSPGDGVRDARGGKARENGPKLRHRGDGERDERGADKEKQQR